MGKKLKVMNWKRVVYVAANEALDLQLQYSNEGMLTTEERKEHLENIVKRWVDKMNEANHESQHR